MVRGLTVGMLSRLSELSDNQTILYDNSDVWNGIRSMYYEIFLSEQQLIWDLVPGLVIVCSNNGQIVLGQWTTALNKLLTSCTVYTPWSQKTRKLRHPTLHVMTLKNGKNNNMWKPTAYNI